MATGQLIKKLRLMKGLKQESVAKKMGVTQQALSKIENANELPQQTIERTLIAMDSNFEELRKLKAFSF